MKMKPLTAAELAYAYAWIAERDAEAIEQARKRPSEAPVAREEPWWKQEGRRLPPRVCDLPDEEEGEWSWVL